MYKEVPLRLGLSGLSTFKYKVETVLTRLLYHCSSSTGRNVLGGLWSTTLVDSVRPWTTTPLVIYSPLGVRDWTWSKVPNSLTRRMDPTGKSVSSCSVVDQSPQGDFYYGESYLRLWKESRSKDTREHSVTRCVDKRWRTFSHSLKYQ